MEKYEVNKLLNIINYEYETILKNIGLQKLEESLFSLNQKMLDPLFWNQKNVSINLI